MFAADEQTSHKVAIKCMCRRTADEHEPYEERNNFSSQISQTVDKYCIRLNIFSSFSFVSPGEGVVE